MGSIALAGLASAACGGRDETSLPRAGSGGLAGSAGRGGDTGIGGGGGSGAGNGGSAGLDLDAGLDASPDAAGRDAAASAGACVVGTLDAYCDTLACPALAEARTVLLGTTAPYLRSIIQWPCVAPSGAARVAVTGQYLQWSRTYIYEAATEQLVGVSYIDDVAGCQALEPSDPGFGYSTGFYGEAAPGCSPDGLDPFIPDGCAFDAGALESLGNGLDAGPPYECVLTP